MLFDAVARRITKSKDLNDNPWLKRVNDVREELKGIPAYKDSYAELSGPRIVKRLRDILPPEAILTTGVGQAPDVVRDTLPGPAAEDLDNLHRAWGRWASGSLRRWARSSHSPTSPSWTSTATEASS